MSDGQTRFTTINIFCLGGALTAVLTQGGPLSILGMGLSLLVAYMIAVSTDLLVARMAVHVEAAEVFRDLPNYLAATTCATYFLVLGEFFVAGIEVALMCSWFWLRWVQPIRPATGHREPVED